MPTPAIAYLTQAQRATAGIVISASHNPYHDDGVKFFNGDGVKLPDSTEEAIEAPWRGPVPDRENVRDLRIVEERLHDPPADRLVGVGDEHAPHERLRSSSSCTERRTWLAR